MWKSNGETSDFHSSTLMMSAMGINARYPIEEARVSFLLRLAQETGLQKNEVR